MAGLSRIVMVGVCTRRYNALESGIPGLGGPAVVFVFG